MTYYQYQQGLHFQEKPVTKEERLIADIIYDFYKALKEKNLDKLVALYASDAKIESLYSATSLSLNDYKELMRAAIKNIMRANLKDITIRFKNEDLCLVSSAVFYHYSSGTIGLIRQLWTLERRENRWLITESLYSNF